MRVSRVTVQEKKLILLDFQRKSFKLEQRIFARVLEIAFHVSRGTFWEKKNGRMFFFGLRAEYSRTLGEKISVVLSKLHSTCPEEHFMGFFTNRFFSKKYKRKHVHSELANLEKKFTI